jgi:hypothetical protein
MEALDKVNDQGSRPKGKHKLSLHPKMWITHVQILVFGRMNIIIENIIHETLFVLKRCHSMERRNIIGNKKMNGVVARSCGT